MQMQQEGAMCPHLRPQLVGADRGISVAIYCGLPDGRARVPARDEVKRYCLDASHDFCPGYRNARVRETFTRGLAASRPATGEKR
jgi:hypothetical protein